MSIYILNSLITPFDFNTTRGAIVKFKRIGIEEAKAILTKQPFISAIGHEATAKLLTQILGISIPTNRIQVFLKPGDMCLHFVLQERLPEGKVLSEEELKKLKYWLVLSSVEETWIRD